MRRTPPVPLPSPRWGGVTAALAAAVLVSACSGAPDTAAARGEAPESSAAAPAPSTSTTVAVDPTPTTDALPPPTTEAPPPTTTAPPGPPPLATEEGPLQSGVEGLRTKAIQEALAAQRFDPGEPDGAFGPKTTMAVWAFQAYHGLPKDGIVTDDVETLILAAPPVGMIRPDLGPTHTEVDLDRQILLVWGDGQLELITHVSTGSGVAYCERGHCGDAVTPTGDHRYQRRIAGERRAPLGVLYSPVYFVGGIAVHGAPSVPNHPASHGCVRIPMHISAYFQDLVVDGESIAVFRGGTGAATPIPPPGGPAQPAPAGADNGG